LQEEQKASDKQRNKRSLKLNLAW